ncbi:MAG: ascorbate-dependent monooxygenase [Acidobacteriota bacterium]
MNVSSTSWTNTSIAFAKTFSLSLLLAISPLSNAAPFHPGVARVLEQHCLPCHRPGEVGPFPLDSYEAARKHARQIALVVAQRYMPPWKPSGPGLRFQHERRLTPTEIAHITAWVKQGMPRGTGQWNPPAPPPPTTAADARCRMPLPADIPAEGRDDYRCFVIPTGLASSRFIDRFAFLPGNRRVVHHALFFFDTSGAARHLDAESPGPGYPCFGTPGFLPASSLGGWSPGNTVLHMPPATAIRVPARADLVLQIHYHPTGKPEHDQSELAVWFAPAPPTKKLLDVALTSRRIDIPPGNANYRVRDHFVLPVDVTLWQIIPHAHLIARQFRAWAISPAGLRRPLLTIPDWDFNWQDIYQLRTPLKLPAGTRLEMEILYDNSPANPRNPSRPPQRVLWGPGTTDEMAGLHFNVTVDNEARDLPDLTHSLWGKMMRALEEAKH